MDTLIEFYDKDVLKNIMAPLTLRPKKVIYLFDRGMTDMTAFAALRKCLVRNIPGVQMEQYPVDIALVQKIYRQILLVLRRNEEGTCGIDLTGGSELMLIAGHKAGLEMGIPMLHTNFVSGQITDLRDDSPVAKNATLTLEDFVDAKGACFMGESHRPPAPEKYEAIKEMARYLFSRLGQWKNTCNFFQTVAARHMPYELMMESKTDIHMKNGKSVIADLKILENFQRLGFICDLVIEEEMVRFSFSSVADKQYCIGYGVWLELYVYISAVEAGVFQDVKLGTMIDWDAYDKHKVAGNEIDVILMDHSLPVFISCKLRDADTATLNELLIAKKRVGGWFSKGVVVAFSREKKELTGTFKRANELGLMLLDASDIMADDFGERLVRSIHAHDLASLKWKKV